MSSRHNVAPIAAVVGLASLAVLSPHASPAAERAGDALTP